jgi:hypothetical protein
LFKVTIYRVARQKNKNKQTLSPENLIFMLDQGHGQAQRWLWVISANGCAVLWVPLPPRGRGRPLHCVTLSNCTPFLFPTRKNVLLIFNQILPFPGCLELPSLLSTHSYCSILILPLQENSTFPTCQAVSVSSRVP